MLLEKFFGQVSGQYKIDSEPSGDGEIKIMCHGYYAESKPLDTYPEAVEYINQQSTNPHFQYGTVEKRFITKEYYEELLAREEDGLPEAVE